MTQSHSLRSGGTKAYLPGRGDTMIKKVVHPGRGSAIAPRLTDLCEFPKCGNLDCIICGSGGLRPRSPLFTCTILTTVSASGRGSRSLPLRVNAEIGQQQTRPLSPAALYCSSRASTAFLLVQNVPVAPVSDPSVRGTVPRTPSRLQQVHSIASRPFG